MPFEFRLFAARVPPPKKTRMHLSACSQILLLLVTAFLIFSGLCVHNLKDADWTAMQSYTVMPKVQPVMVLGRLGLNLRELETKRGGLNLLNEIELVEKDETVYNLVHAVVDRRSGAVRLTPRVRLEWESKLVDGRDVEESTIMALRRANMLVLWIVFKCLPPFRSALMRTLADTDKDALETITEDSVHDYLIANLESIVVAFENFIRDPRAADMFVGGATRLDHSVPVVNLKKIDDPKSFDPSIEVGIAASPFCALLSSHVLRVNAAEAHGSSADLLSNAVSALAASYEPLAQTLYWSLPQTLAGSFANLVPLKRSYSWLVTAISVLSDYHAAGSFASGGVTLDITSRLVLARHIIVLGGYGVVLCITGYFWGRETFAIRLAALGLGALIVYYHMIVRSIEQAASHVGILVVRSGGGEFEWFLKIGAVASLVWLAVLWFGQISHDRNAWAEDLQRGEADPLVPPLQQAAGTAEYTAGADNA